jgi:hypothetical protein
MHPARSEGLLAWDLEDIRGINLYEANTKKHELNDVGADLPVPRSGMSAQVRLILRSDTAAV